MMYEKHFRLVSHLLNRTRNGQLDWQVAADCDGYQVSFSRNTVRIRSVQNYDSGADYVIDLINDHGVVAETFSDVELDRASGAEPLTYFARMSELHEMARRTALGSDKMLNEILNDLENG